MVSRAPPPAILLVLLCFVFAACSMPAYDPPGGQTRASYDPYLDGWRPASWIPFCVADTITDFAFGNGRYVAVSATGVIGWSDDGDRWFRAATDLTVSNFNAVAFGGGVFVAAGNGGVFANSLNGEHWIVRTEMDGFDGLDITGVAYGDGRFVAVGGLRRVPTIGGGSVPGSPRIAHSVNGIDWTGETPSGFGAERLNGVDFGRVFVGTAGNYEYRFFAVGDGGRRGWTRNPAAGWSFQGPTAPIGTANITAVTVGNRGVDERGNPGVGIGVAFGDGRTAIATQPDTFAGFDADLRTFLFYLPPNIQEPWVRVRALKNVIVYAGGYFVAAGTGAMIGFWPSAEPSRDSQRFWRALTFPEFMLWEITAVAALNGRFFVGNVGGRIGHGR